MDQSTSHPTTAVEWEYVWTLTESALSSTVFLGGGGPPQSCKMFLTCLLPPRKPIRLLWTFAYLHLRFHVLNNHILTQGLCENQYCETPSAGHMDPTTYIPLYFLSYLPLYRSLYILLEGPSYWVHGPLGLGGQHFRSGLRTRDSGRAGGRLSHFAVKGLGFRMV